MKKSFMTMVALMSLAGAAWGATINVPANQPTIEAALAAALAGDTITIDNGIYNPVGTLAIDKSLTITGASEAGVIINIPAAGVYGMLVTADLVTLQNFTLAANSANPNYPIHASGTDNAPAGYFGLTIDHVTVSGTHVRTGFDVHGYSAVNLTNLTSTDATGGNGLQVTGVSGATISNITTANNAWGSIAIYCSGPSYLNRGSDNISVNGGTLSLGESNLYSQDEFGLSNTNITVFGYNYVVTNSLTIPGYELFQPDLPAAQAAAAGSGLASATIQLIGGGPFFVYNGMSIQAAIDAAAPGNLVSVDPGVYREQLTITKDLFLGGAGAAVTTIEAPDAIDRTPYAITTWTGSVKSIDAIVGIQSANVNISGFKIDGRDTGPNNFYGIHGTDMSGSISSCEVVDVTYSAQAGAQNVLSIVLTQTAAPGPFNIDVSSNTVPTFQKGGIAIGGPGYVFTVANNTVTANPSPSIAGNGIQLGYGATGTTTNNVVSGVGYTGTDWAGTGILLFECGNVTMTGDQVSGSQNGVAYNDWHWVYNAPGQVALEFNNLFLMGNEWSFGVQLSGDGSNVDVAMNNCFIVNSSGDAIDIYGTDVDPWGGTYYTGWANGQLSVAIDGLILDTAAIDGIWTADYSGAATNAVSGFNVTNTLFSNVTGSAIANELSTQIKAEENYWGDINGPTAGAKSGGAPKQVVMAAPWGDDTPKTAGSIEVARGAADKAGLTVTGLVDYSPWYGDPIGFSPMTVGTNDDINDAIALANNGDTVLLAPTTFTLPAQVVVNKSVTFQGAGEASTIINAGYNTGTSAYNPSAALFYVDYGVTTAFQFLAIDGNGHVVNQAIQSRGASTSLFGCTIRNIASSIYDGRGVVFLTGTGQVQFVTMSGIQRIGVHVRGNIEPAAPTVAIDGIFYTGKGPGDWLDYGVEFGAGGSGTVGVGNISACQGVASTDGSTSAGILVTDYYGNGTTADINGVALFGNSTGLAVGYDVSDMSAVTITGSTIYGNTEYGVSSTGVSVNALGNTWGDPSGPFHPMLNPGGLGNPVTDNVVFEYAPLGAEATAVLSDSGPINCSETVSVTFYYVPNPALPDLFLYDATVSVSGELAFGTISGQRAIFNNTGFTYTTDNVDGSKTITASTLATGGDPYEAANGQAALFTINFLPVADGIATITVTDLVLRDPTNATMPVTLPTAVIEVDCTAPVAVTGITATPGHNKVNVGWTHDGIGVDHFAVFSGLWYDTTPGVSAYPEYDDLLNDVIPAAPASPANATSSGQWVGPMDVSGVNTLVQTWPNADDRGVYYYTVFAIDAAGNVSAAPAAIDRATNYWLGDVAINGLVEVNDFTALGTNFGLANIPTNSAASPLDVGPTDDWSRLGIPTTDSKINFEDLMIFSLNFGVVSAAKDKAPVSKVIDLAWVTYDDGSMALRLVNGSGLKGLNVRADLPVGSVEAGQLLDDQSELTFVKNIGQNLDVSVAVMGVNQGFEGAGDLFIVRAESGITVDDLHITARGTDNSNLEFTLDTTSGTLTPRVFGLNANYPNPFNPMTKISFSLPEAQNVRLNVYGLDGRRVATLLNETRGPGLHEVVWNGRNDAGQSVASGMYLYRIEAGPYSQVRKMTLTK